jgi:hypothetical protein
MPDGAVHFLTPPQLIQARHHWLYLGGQASAALVAPALQDTTMLFCAAQESMTAGAAFFAGLICSFGHMDGYS